MENLEINRNTQIRILRNAKCFDKFSCFRNSSKIGYGTRIAINKIENLVVSIINQKRVIRIPQMRSQLIKFS